MDPVGPWSAYPPYNRLSGVQAGAGTTELHHHLSAASGAGAPPVTTAPILPGGFLSPPSVAYEAVFSPLFHPKQPHYVAQHRQAIAQAQAAAQAQVQAATATKQASDGEYQTQSFFEQGTTPWQQSSPFGILPHESVPTSSSKTTMYENFNAHFAAAQSLNHLNSQIAAAKTSITTRAQSPQITSSVTKVLTTQSNSNAFFQVPNTFSGTDNNTNKSTFSTTTSNNLQQSCIVSAASNAITSKEYRIPQGSSRGGFPTPSNRNNLEKSYGTSNEQNATPQIQTKAQTKIYPELANQTERQRNLDKTPNQSSPVSFPIDSQVRMSYTGNNAAGKRNQFQHNNYRHYTQGNNVENEFARPKNGPDYNGGDCNVVVPRRPSPLQAHSQASPLGHAPSPAYPMYNSPMNSISSPQQNTNNQITPATPLDVSVPRPNSQTNNIAYPSVITRALNSQTAQQNCWDERNQVRKFQTTQNNNSYNSNSNNGMEVNRVDNMTQRSVTTTDRQQNYFESGHQVTLQDLSSCRGDPMSIVKNLQQSCHVQSDMKPETKASVKRRKSNEKQMTSEPHVPVDYFARMPPPAHSTGTNQQQPNGYFDFDRWNLPTPPKMFSTQPIHQQHQGLMVPHPHSHHPAPPLPYFPTFHIPPHPPEFNSTNDMNSLPLYNEQAGQSTSSTQFAQVEEQPKVVVPNIEEELNFLSGTYSNRTNTNVRPNCAQSENKTVKVNGPGAGFMNSYLKFLQGERDNSPPPTTRGGRRQTWTNMKPKIEVKQEPVNGVQHVNLLPIQQPPPIVQNHPAVRLSNGDPQDDPRYFPLPKERKNNTFDSSDDGISSGDDLFPKKVSPSMKDTSKEKSSKKGRPCKPGGPTERKRAKQAASNSKQQSHDNLADLIDREPIQRRETSKRAAKEKINMKQTDDDAEEPPEFADSDSDPAWTPLAKDDLDEDLTTKKGKRSRTIGRGRGRGGRNIISTAVKSAGIQDTDGYSSDSSQKKNKTSNKTVSNLYNENSVVQKNNVAGNDNPFKPGEFVAIKSELNQDWPSIWRIDGRTLLQKYEPFEDNGMTLYRNISTYTSWTPESKKIYISVPIRFVSQHPLETIVQFLRNDINIMDQEFLNKFIKENATYQDNFEVYIQTLISQALDSNFLTEIFQEQDEYFLTNVKIIDNITDSKKQKLLNILRWPQTVQIAVSTWPCFNVISELSNDMRAKLCAACNKTTVEVRVLMYGQPYNTTTLDGCQPDPQTAEKKDFYMCQLCVSRMELFNKITHQKYLMYIECAKRVADKRQQDATKDTTFILNELLADEEWLTQLFTDVRTIWAEVENLEKKYVNKTLSNVQ